MQLPECKLPWKDLQQISVLHPLSLPMAIEKSAPTVVSKQTKNPGCKLKALKERAPTIKPWFPRSISSNHLQGRFWVPRGPMAASNFSRQPCCNMLHSSKRRWQVTSDGSFGFCSYLWWEAKLRNMQLFLMRIRWKLVPCYQVHENYRPNSLHNDCDSIAQEVYHFLSLYYVGALTKHSLFTCLLMSIVPGRRAAVCFLFTQTVYRRHVYMLYVISTMFVFVKVYTDLYRCFCGKDKAPRFLYSLPLAARL